MTLLKFARINRNFTLLLLLLLCTFPAAASAPLAATNTQRYYLLQMAMQLLGTWALGNLIYSSFLLPKASRSRRYFYQMNLFSNVLFLLIAALATIFALTASPSLSLSESIRQHFLIEKILVLGIGMSVAGVVTGMLLRSNARNTRKPEKGWGYGRSIIIQGLFMLLFTIGLYVAISRFGTDLAEAVP